MIARRSRGHDPERDAARFLAGEGRRRWRDRFEAHLVSCEVCWREVQLGRRGRALAESARELAPPPLREQIRAAVEMSNAGRPRAGRVRWTVVAPALAALLAVGGLVAFLALQGSNRQPEPIAAAVAAFRSRHLPVSGPPDHPVPDLSSAGLRLDAAGRTDLDGLGSDAFTYRAAGRVVLLFIGPRGFPEANGARERSGSMPGWEVTTNGVALVCADTPVPYLLLSDDPVLLLRAEQALRSQPLTLKT